MSENINTREYWERRFSSKDWENNHGRWQTESFARGQIPHLNIPSDFKGEILDFGCGLGDAIPVYRENFPLAKLLGLDISQTAVEKCRESYGEIATFFQGSYDAIPDVDVIVASNVLEHLTDDRNVAKHLLSKCKSFYIIVPYKEWPLISEHVNTYDEDYFSTLGQYTYKVFPCAGWSPVGLRGLWYNVYFKNVFRFLLRKPLRKRGMQIIFCFDRSAI